MFRLRLGYVLTGIATGLVLLFSFLDTIPDGKLHIVFCDVGQGDAAYIRFPDGRDMLVDGGPNDKVLGCLGKHMPFWDRHINLVIMTHPQKDHFAGLISVLSRYRVDYFVRSDVDNTTESYQKLQEVVRQKNIPVKFATRGESISIGKTKLGLLWPSDEQIALGKGILATRVQSSANNTLETTIVGDLNDYCIVFLLSYGSFDALFTGDADSRVEGNYVGLTVEDGTVEVLKVPHHGSKTGMSSAFVDWVRPQLAVISVGKNSYGHPTPEAINMLSSTGVSVRRTDKEGDIEVVSDGKGWQMQHALETKAN